MKVHRLEIATRPPLPDARGLAVAATVRDFLGIPVASVRTRDVHHVEADLSEAEAARVLHEFVDPIAQQGALGRLEDGPFGVAVTVAYKPGVTDPVGKSARVCVEDTLSLKLAADAAVYTSTMYLLDGVDVAAARRIATELLANPVIQTIRIEAYEAWQASAVDFSIPKIAAHATRNGRRRSFGLGRRPDCALRAKAPGLDPSEMTAIRDHFLRAGLPTDVELECIAQTWSEHSSTRSSMRP